MTTKKKIVLTLIFIVLLIASNLIGGIIGFNAGFEAGLYLDGLDIMTTISNLNNLRADKTDWPIKFLEMELDWKIYNAGTSKNSYNSIYNILKYDSELNATRHETEAMKQAIKYRRLYPSEFSDEEFRTKINNILNKYETVDD